MTKRIISILSALMLILSMVSCNEKKEPFMFFAMNTFFTADIECDDDEIFSLLQNKAAEMEKIYRVTVPPELYDGVVDIFDAKYE